MTRSPVLATTHQIVDILPTQEPRDKTLENKAGHNNELHDEGNMRHENYNDAEWSTASLDDEECHSACSSANVSVLTAMAGREVMQRITRQHHTLFYNIICQIFPSFRRDTAWREQQHHLNNAWQESLGFKKLLCLVESDCNVQFRFVVDRATPQMYHSNKCFANTMKHYQLLSMFLSCMPRPFMKVEAKAFCDTSVDLVSVDSGLQSVYMICFTADRKYHETCLELLKSSIGQPTALCCMDSHPYCSPQPNQQSEPGFPIEPRLRAGEPLPRLRCEGPMTALLMDSWRPCAADQSYILHQSLTVGTSNNQHQAGFEASQNDLAFVKSEAKGAPSAQNGSIDGNTSNAPVQPFSSTAASWHSERYDGQYAAHPTIQSPLCLYVASLLPPKIAGEWRVSVPPRVASVWIGPLSAVARHFNILLAWSVVATNVAGSYHCTFRLKHFLRLYYIGAWSAYQGEGGSLKSFCRVDRRVSK
ncbi:hypothetical protein LA080_004613 [Diaporthe eres]|nr:hypothetical protein LA080_004613 [Diaporthe eres]